LFFDSFSRIGKRSPKKGLSVISKVALDDDDDDNDDVKEFNGAVLELTSFVKGSSNVEIVTDIYQVSSMHSVSIKQIPGLGSQTASCIRRNSTNSNNPCGAVMNTSDAVSSRKSVSELSAIDSYITNSFSHILEKAN
jgi:hypothetical protein